MPAQLGSSEGITHVTLFDLGCGRVLSTGTIIQLTSQVHEQEAEAEVEQLGLQITGQWEMPALQIMTGTAAP